MLGKRESFEQRLAREAERLKKQGEKLKPGAERDDLRHRLRQLQAARYVNEWISSPGLQPPKQADRGWPVCPNPNPV
jgi:hypothetical protein